MFKKLLIGIIFLGTGGAGIAYYLWTQATALPSWFQGQSSDPQSFAQPPQLTLPSTDVTPAIASTKQKIQQKVQTAIQNQGMNQIPEDIAVSLNAQDFNQLLQAEISNQLQSRKISPVLPQIQANLANNNLELGTVINPVKLKTLDLPRRQQAMVARVVSKFPQLKDQDIYVGIEGKPKLENGQLTLPNNSQVRIGNLTFSLSEVAQKLGVPRDRLQQSLNLNIDELNLQDLQFKDNEVILKVNPSDYVPQ
ncbi:MAG: hypothetical protein ACKO4S_06105 [Snowella sp.]